MPQPGAAMPRGDRDESDQPPAPDSALDDAWRGFGGRGRARAGSEPIDAGSESELRRAEEISSDTRTSAGGGVPGRRTVTIRGQGSERYVPRRASGARRPAERRYERAGFQPDRTAMWAVLLGVMLILAAAASAHATTLHALTRLH